MDTPSSESGELDVNQAASLFANLVEPDEKPATNESPTDEASQPESEAVETEAPAEAEASESDAQKVTIEIDGKTVELTPEQIKEAYKAGLRQDDYTRKTMQVAEQRKAAEAEIARARHERESYAQNLAQAQALLQASLVEQGRTINWDALAQNDPAEFVKQKHLYEQRQAAFQQNQARLAQLEAVRQSEAQRMEQLTLSEQQESLLAKLPNWKDPAKAKTEREGIKKTLAEYGFRDEEIANVKDHRAVLLARDAMLYRQMMAKTNAAEKKVANAPPRVERPAGGEKTGLDKRAAQFQKLGKTGRVEDAAALFASIL